MEYQRKKNNKYILPATVYNQTVWIIRDYYRMCEELHNIAVSSPDRDEGPSAKGSVGNGVASKVIAREKLHDQIKVIEDSLAKIPPEYQRGVWESIVKRKAYPLDAARVTYARYKSKMIYDVAKGLHIIDDKT